MTIQREAVRRMDFKKLATGKRLAPIHPGDVLMKELIEPLALSRYKVAKLIGVQQRRVDEICAGKRGVTADTALRLARLFDTTPEFWMNLQSQYDLEVAQRAMRKQIERDVTPLQEAA
jgi:antitoxin HigA-1